jgi:hypothetical protein
MLQSNKRDRFLLPLSDSAREADSKEGAMKVNSKVLPNEIAQCVTWVRVENGWMWVELIVVDSVPLKVVCGGRC